jgi:hypothetical protein
MWTGWRLIVGRLLEEETFTEAGSRIDIPLEIIEQIEQTWRKGGKCMHETA